ncbi:MAG: hypothetical protein A2534_00080 [Candidatus Magasanikbacteria bacterium RIFOXYD2_FULL_39_9]|uniref:Uncharacterized protein n=1 Tax=Candidatus Magasanikbacteria bacterium RIFOXYD1_FULL_40_23 TaxID=1798705 RepID=A0A1F6P9J3_9BACT|nr:MAG: hypothetical protein A2563_03030 [Candidatus Magasanikbacteria bacterium RIFOXYD1_FULL_40_23]OGH93546.1 MAG: hypothetical protein A2534_00080 [Candidatus Magasanikbacteria bacterium RIFOXYD2_FULL_39_9]
MSKSVKTNKIQTTTKATHELKPRDIVYPNKEWEAYTASAQARIPLEPNTGYEVREWNGNWLGLKPKPGMATTVVWVDCKDRNKPVKVNK